MICNFPFSLSGFQLENDIYDSTQPKKTLEKFQLGLKNVKIFYISQFVEFSSQFLTLKWCKRKKRKREVRNNILLQSHLSAWQLPTSLTKIPHGIFPFFIIFQYIRKAKNQIKRDYFPSNLISMYLDGTLF